MVVVSDPSSHHRRLYLHDSIVYLQTFSHKLPSSFPVIVYINSVYITKKYKILQA